MINVREWSITKLVTIISSTIVTTIAITGALFQFHATYEDEPKIIAATAQVREEVIAMSDQNTNKLLLYIMRQDINQYEDELEDLEEKKREGTANRYDLRKLDRYNNRIRQINRSIEQVQ